jgi:hypothetical protein
VLCVVAGCGIYMEVIHSMLFQKQMKTCILEIYGAYLEYSKKLWRPQETNIAMRKDKARLLIH